MLSRSLPPSSQPTRSFIVRLLVAPAPAPTAVAGACAPAGAATPFLPQRRPHTTRRGKCSSRGRGAPPLAAGRREPGRRLPELVRAFLSHLQSLPPSLLPSLEAPGARRRRGARSGRDSCGLVPGACAAARCSVRGSPQARGPSLQPCSGPSIAPERRRSHGPYAVTVARSRLSVTGPEPSLLSGYAATAPCAVMNRHATTVPCAQLSPTAGPRAGVRPWSRRAARRPVPRSPDPQARAPERVCGPGA